MASVKDLSSRIPKGKNTTQSTIELYNEKKFYYNEVYPGGELPWMDKPFDFINENPLYGKVNLNGDFLIPKYNLVDGVPKYERVVEVDTESAGVMAFDFVVEAFNDLKENIMSLVKAGLLSKEGPIAKLKAYKGFVDFASMNKLQKEIHYFMFVSQYLSKSSTANSGIKYKEMLENAHDFTAFFVSYLKTHAKTMPFTKSGVISSFYMSPLSTGLCLEIDEKPYDNDQKKHDFLKDPNFNVYRMAARRFGFMVDRNVPWRLVADVRSYKMREYMRLAYERKMLKERQDTILEKREKEIKDKFPELPTLGDLFEVKNGKWVKKPWPDVMLDEKKLEKFRQATENELIQAAYIVSLETKDHWINKELYGAKDPNIDENGIALCTGKNFKICLSRIFRFDKFFEVYYDVPYLDEVQEIKNIFYKFFLSYYVQNPTIKKKVICTDKNLRTKFIVKETNVTMISQKKYNEHYSRYFWLKIYFDIKLSENNIKLKKKEYDSHMQHILDLSTLNDKNKNNLFGYTTKNSGHTHKYFVDENGNGEATLLVHPTKPNIFHFHKIKDWMVEESQSNCYPECIEGLGLHAHNINNDFIHGLGYINKVIRKKMKGVAQIYGVKGQIKEGKLESMLTAFEQEGVGPSLFSGIY